MLSGRRQRPRPTAHPKELPPCRGPKLRAFRHHDSPIEWLGRLDAGSGFPLEDSDSGRQGYVFKVRIESELYALKVFKFYNAEDSRWSWEAYVSGDDPKRLAELHLDPFYAECRAYGRIHMAKSQGKIKRDIGVPCYGFIYLDDRYRKQLDEYGVDLDESCLDSDASANSSPTPGARRATTSRPIRSIVKKLASSDPGITYKTIENIRKDIQELNRLEVYNTDIRRDNFCDGKEWLLV
ncbi:hypothetical protein LMH87_001233 [Akanthomyces muscarius]|uniref:Uncharacterized protein n=1 Tax=Akanthomyces muscarius TaxID=2231603 RepID=A0A9W8UPI6_AKAMU|nr:hypothetical protein LMH87_001233 [Akanthomyces muscarius]KAJ4156019.1 hypothetical protein LMH87_001233 [Akanthomyces muscarius]